MLNITDLHGYQQKANNYVKEHPKCGLFLEMGLGKTVSVLTAINFLIYEDLELDKVLIIAPKRVASSVWDREVEKWAHLKHLKVKKIDGTPKQRQKIMREPADIYTISVNNVAWLCGEFGGGMLPYDMVVIDESSTFKNPSSVRFKALRKAIAHVSRVVILTGTPAPNGLADLWSQIYLLDRGQRLGKYISHFREDYLKPVKFKGHMILAYEPTDIGKDLIYDKINDICLSMEAKDYLDLKEPIRNNIIIPMPKPLKKKYLDFEKEKVFEVIEEVERKAEESGEYFEAADCIAAINGAALSNKLQQFANGSIYDENRDVHKVHNLKGEALREVVEGAAGKPVLVAYAFKHDLTNIMKVLKDFNPVKLESDSDIDEWNKGNIKVLVMHPASGGHGLNIQDGGNTIVWYGQTWSLELLQQFNARLHRQGQKNTVIIHKLILEGTVDEKILKAQESKNLTQKSLMEAMKDTVSKYVHLYNKK